MHLIGTEFFIPGKLIMHAIQMFLIAMQSLIVVIFSMQGKQEKLLMRTARE